MDELDVVPAGPALRDPPSRPGTRLVPGRGLRPHLLSGGSACGPQLGEAWRRGRGPAPCGWDPAQPGRLREEAGTGRLGDWRVCSLPWLWDGFTGVQISFTHGACYTHAVFIIAYFSVSEVAQSCPTLCDPWAVACQVPPSMGFFQARILEWVAISFSRGSSWPPDWGRVSRYNAADALPSEPPGKPNFSIKQHFKNFLY